MIAAPSPSSERDRFGCLFFTVMIGVVFTQMVLYKGGSSGCDVTNNAEACAIARNVGLRPGSVFADVGANDGSWTEEYLKFIRPGGKAYATDASSNMGWLNSLSSRFGDELTAVALDTHPNRGLPADESLDAIIMRMSFHYEHSPSKAGAAYFKALKPGGRLMIMEHPGCSWATKDDENPSLSTIQERNPDGVMNPLGSGHQLAWPPLRQTFKALGFEVREHGVWPPRGVAAMWPSCSYYAVFGKPWGLDCETPSSGACGQWDHRA